ncbi:hypothetical protein FC093_10990 [Ilyomonas limi]|uniref:Tetratricopeptide repeat protein n=1 Tax=Ilyomonas limi TaxID=2575867 RepID=A0A4U3L301_9BACT|nr:tetratricopeptide repeat protein [Ilyomonas limi]TKK68634.1 hypothetical protein FC093_10990 [Ilyomonas limi]
MKKTLFLVLGLALATVCTRAQSIDEGIKDLYYGKTQSARTAFQKVVDKNPKDGRAIYWLGQSMLVRGSEDVTGAKQLYQNALNSGINDPYVLVGMGQIDLINGDTSAAKQKFEQAITMSNGKRGKQNPDVLNAIGRANAYGSAKIGDPAYAIDKLKAAAQIDPKNPDIYINMGINYLKMGSDKGGEAVQAFQNAAAIDPNYAAAYERIGNVYKSQDNKPSMEEWYSKAVAADQTFAPVYFDWFDYYKNRDVNAAQEYLNNYVKYADQDCRTAFFKADYLFRAGKYEESKAQADSMAAGQCATYPGLNILYAYNYDRLGDSAQAKSYLDKYFDSARINGTDVDPDYYMLAGKVYSKFPGLEDTAVNYLTKAMQADTVAKNQQKYIDTIASIYKKANRPVERLEWRRKSFALNKEASSRDYYDLTDAAIMANDTTFADSIINAYMQAYPDQPYAYTFALKNAKLKDTTGAAAVEPTAKYIEYLKQDTAKNAATIAYYYALQGTYYANVAQNLDSALAQFRQAVQYAPDNTQYQNIVQQLEKAANKAKEPADKPSATKPKSGGK